MLLLIGYSLLALSPCSLPDLFNTTSFSHVMLRRLGEPGDEATSTVHLTVNTHTIKPDQEATESLLLCRKMKLAMR